MQEWLSQNLTKIEGLADLITNIDEIENFKPNSLVNEKIHNSFKYCIKSLKLNSVISENENISLKKGDSLKPDFLLYAPETESIVIIELKNISGTTRQAGTEISAYASEIKSFIPFISEGDIINVIISPVWPTLLKHYVFHEIFWLQRNIICIEPFKDGVNIKLNILDILSFTEDNVTLKLSDKHLGGYQLCLYDDSLYKDRENRNRLDPFIEQMKTALSAIATKGYSQKNHGFAFLWKDNWKSSLAPYSITILNFAPFQSIERLFHDENYEINDITEKFIKIIVDYAPIGHGESLSEITDAGISFLDNFCSPRMEGFSTWADLKELMKHRCDLKAFKCWGIFDELFSNKLQEEYKKGNIQISSTDPNLGWDLLNELIDPNYEFIDLSYYKYTPDNDESFLGLIDKTKMH
ncbi:MAG: hypothetical protein HOO91_16310 [Bacteroidales bacterium]|nr:hypothetical protein [Bacteroidales bacterium]